MDHIHIETVIVGAGVVGIALARELAMRGGEVVVLESEERMGSVVSARNSGVIHAGLYYPPNSLKARLCVEGRDMLYAYAATRDIWHQRSGKFVVATGAEQVDALHKLKQNAEANGVANLSLMSTAQVRAIEPELSCVEAIYSPDSGTIDVHKLLSALWADAEQNGAALQLNYRLARAEIASLGGFIVYVEGATPYAIHCKRLVNAAGLGAQQVAALVKGYDPKLIPEQLLGKGSYFSLGSKKAPFRHLVYPMPIAKSSGLHFRVERDGRAVFGPDYQPVDTVNYDIDPARAVFFFEQVRQYYPNLRQEDLMPDYAGIRPKLKTEHDFVLQGQGVHGVPNLMHCFGIDSPGLTSCMAIARTTAHGFQLS